MFALLWPLLLAAAVTVPGPSGADVYVTQCSSCHGSDMRGSADGPSLHGVGLATVDFYLSTGRMPAAVPWLEVAHRDVRSGQGLDLRSIRALEAYLAPVAGGPQIPLVVAGGNLVRGRALYRLNCEQCHGAEAGGGGLGELAWVPPLQAATINDVADAVRSGPGEMPRFAERQLSQSDLDDVASYVMAFRTPAADPGPPYRSSGPVPEGAVGYLALIALVTFVFTLWRSSGADHA
jgi:ubiquinol-cytochrome c reductase cytochrome c subunit